MGRPPIGAERNAVLRRLIRELQQQDYGGNLTVTAAALGIKPGTLSDFLNEKRGAGMKVVDGLAAVLRRDVGQILASDGDLAVLRGAASLVAPRAREVRFADLPNWPELREAAKSLKPEAPDWALDRLSVAPVLLEGPVTPALVADLIDVVRRHVAPPAAPSAKH